LIFPKTAYIRMQRQQFFALFCVISVGMNAFVAGVPVRPRPRLSLEAMKLHASGSHKNVNPNALEFETFSRTKEGGARDYISDLIWYLLGLTVGAFFSVINYNLLPISNTVNTSKLQLENAMQNVDEAIKQDLRVITEGALIEAKNIIDILVGKFGRVLPSLSSVGGIIFTDPNDIIYALLGISLEDFLKEITSILQRTDTLLDNTIRSLLSIAGRVNPSVAETLRSSATDMGRARDAIRPLLNQLWQVLPSLTGGRNNFE